jgi:hypothetical protein
MQPGERQLHLRLDAGSARHPAPGGCPARYSSSAVLPTPASPCTTSARLSPARTASTSRSNTPHSARRPVSPPVRCHTGNPPGACTRPRYLAPARALPVPATHRGIRPAPRRSKLRV